MILRSLIREGRFLAYDRAYVAWVLVLVCLASIALWSGLTEVRQQHDTIQRLLQVDEEDRTTEFSKQNDWGSAAYYSFHLTYEPPSDFAFAAMGKRDSAPWKHRLRMLALEGQIYEHDAGNPELALVGRFDFAFLVAFVLPLIIIFLLHDLQAGERRAGRFNLLVATAGSASKLWWQRALLRVSGILLVVILPLLLAGLAHGTALTTLFSAILVVLVYGLFWLLLCFWLASWKRTPAVILSTLIGGWVVFSALLPAVGAVIIDRMVPVPSGSEILMTQREAVNDAWDLPVEDTMVPFVERHPEWADYTELKKGSFDWKWYYAFQQVGDQTAEQLSQAYREGRLERERLAGLLALAAPPVLVERWLQKLAGTDLPAMLAYEDKVRSFHAELRTFYYPGLFRNDPFEKTALSRLPVFGGN